MQNNRDQQTQQKPANVLAKPGPVTPTDVPVTSHFVHFHHTNIPRILNKRLMVGDSLKLVSDGDHLFEIFVVGHVLNFPQKTSGLTPWDFALRAKAGSGAI